ncbi:hypothetical protein [Leucobacter chromiireducens]|uniref:hypothetical protein n=1 Tax=Leucobacter chromiireducens TaxID=283877 RepID=UPI000F64145E|nr:hypothetical protein [Leucobacter chromiireducens]
MRDPEDVTGGTGGAGNTGGTGGTSGTPAPPIPEPTDDRSAQALAALMFKPKLDPERRLPQAPDAPPAPVHGGERPEIPVVYGARAVPEPASPAPVQAAPSAGRADPAQDPAPLSPGRTALPSLARQNSRFRRAVLVGGPALLVGVSAGIAAIVWLLLG